MVKLLLEKGAGDGNNCWFGMKGYWIVAPDDKLVEVYYLKDKGEYQLLKTYLEDDIIESQIIKGLKIELNRVFA